MKLAEKMQVLNLNKTKKARKPVVEAERIEQDVKTLWGPFLLILGKLVALLVVIPTAVMEGIYEGIRRAVTVLKEAM